MHSTNVHVYEPHDPRLGRHIVHDSRSPRVRQAVETTALPTRSIEHKRNGPIFDQGEIGSCTANAARGLLLTGPPMAPRIRVH